MTDEQMRPPVEHRVREKSPFNAKQKVCVLAMRPVAPRSCPSRTHLTPKSGAENCWKHIPVASCRIVKDFQALKRATQKRATSTAHRNCKDDYTPADIGRSSHGLRPRRLSRRRFVPSRACCVTCALKPTATIAKSATRCRRAIAGFAQDPRRESVL